MRRHGVAVTVASQPHRCGVAAAMPWPVMMARHLPATLPRRRGDAKPLSIANISCSQHFRAAVTGKPAKLNNFNAFYGLLLRGFFPGEQVRLAGDDFLVEAPTPAQFFPN